MNDASQNLDLIIIQGATLIKTIVYLAPDGSAVNLTDYTADMIFRNTVEDTGAPVIELSTADNSIVINGIAGTVTVTMPSVITAALTNGQILYYNLFIYSPTGIVTGLLAGKAIFQGSTIR